MTLPSAIIFDLDGTLVDSLHVSLDILYRLVHRAPLPVEDMSALRGMTLRQMLHRLHITPLKALFVRRQAYRAMSERLSELTLIPGAYDMLRTLAGRYPLYLVSSNDTANINAVLEQFGLAPYIKAMAGGTGALSKFYALRRIASCQKLDRATAWYVGDQARDVRAAHLAGMRAAAVSWGFSNVHVLEAVRPDLLVFTPEELVAYFMNGVSHD